MTYQSLSHGGKKSRKSLTPQWGLGNESLMSLFGTTQGIQIQSWCFYPRDLDMISNMVFRSRKSGSLPEHWVPNAAWKEKESRDACKKAPQHRNKAPEWAVRGFGWPTALGNIHPPAVFHWLYYFWLIQCQPLTRIWVCIYCSLLVKPQETPALWKVLCWVGV